MMGGGGGSQIQSRSVEGVRGPETSSIASRCVVRASLRRAVTSQTGQGSQSAVIAARQTGRLLSLSTYGKGEKEEVEKESEKGAYCPRYKAIAAAVGERQR